MKQVYRNVTKQYSGELYNVSRTSLY